MRRPILPMIERAVLLAMVPACGSAMMVVKDGGGTDAGDDETVDSMNDVNDMDGGLIQDVVAVDIPVIPLPDGCVVTGKPDVFAPCGYTEFLNDPVLCQVDQDADIQDANVCFTLCSSDEPDCVYYNLGDAGSILSCGPGCIGRLHAAARAEVMGRCERVDASAADYLARAAELEAASVDAFRILAAELRACRAPQKLVRAAERAAKDETRHARIVGRLAARSGARSERPRGVQATSRKPRPLLAISIENAIEGCVRETYGVALALWQAQHAEDRVVRGAMKSIAADEARHADLAWQIDAWAMTQLDDHGRAAVRDARKSAVKELEATLGVADLAAPLHAELGLPAPSRARVIFGALRETVWAAAAAQ
jgi:rubrerythrin